MKLAYVFIEHPILHLDHTFTYRCDGLMLQRGVRVLVPFGNKQIVGFVMRIEDVDESYVETVGYKIRNVIQQIDQEPLLNEELLSLGEWMAQQYLSARIACYQCMLPSKLKPSSHHGRIKMEAWVRYVQDTSVKLTTKQQEALLFMKEHKEMLRASFYAKCKTPGKKLIELGCVEVFEKEAQAILEDINKEEYNMKLNQDQQQVIQSVQQTEEASVFLLHGVTGSGKTEVFLQLAQNTIQKGLQVVILVPEISLTPQMVKKVTKRFGSHVAIYHSGLNAQEKYEQYQLVKQHKVQIVVGTRSAIFMPFDHLGLIILDEEHDSSYKQDASPRYHCRDIAIQRGKFHKAHVILASATPSLESYARAHKGIYRLLEMPNRVNDCFPEVHVVQMKQAVLNNESYIVSNRLLDAIYNRLQKKEQVILLLNRRGYTPILRCISCGYIQMCPHCELALSYHKEEQVLKCHTCGYQQKVPHHCPNCYEASWRYLGIGTQKLEEFIQIKFPQARILRMDADTTMKKNAHEEIFSSFARKEADILLGTQMIAKGLDFENVTLVGIVNADAMLQRSDYRSAELTFDLLAQACGRSGRGSKQGEVIMQAYSVDHYAIQCAAKHDYLTFFKQEMKYRHLGGYPPYRYLVSFVISHKEEQQVQQAMQYMMRIVDKKSDCKVLGPAMLLKLKDLYRMRVIIKGKNQQLLQLYAKDVYLQHISLKLKAKLDIDVNPMMLE